MIEYCKSEGIQVEAYSPIAQTTTDLETINDLRV